MRMVSVCGGAHAAWVGAVAGASPQHAGERPVPGGLLLDGAHLASVRGRLDAGDGRVLRHVAELEADARKALSLRPSLVMGRSLRRALDFLMPYTTGDRQFEGAQITQFRPGEIHPLLRRAAVGWKEPRYRELAASIGGGSTRLDLTLP